MTPTALALRIGTRIYEARMHAGYSQSRLAEVLGVHVRTVSAWERGIKNPPVARLQQIAAACGTTIQDLLTSGDTGRGRAADSAQRTERR